MSEYQNNSIDYRDYLFVDIIIRIDSEMLISIQFVRGNHIISQSTLHTTFKFQTTPGSPAITTYGTFSLYKGISRSSSKID